MNAGGISRALRAARMLGPSFEALVGTGAGVVVCVVATAPLVSGKLTEVGVAGAAAVAAAAAALGAAVARWLTRGLGAAAAVGQGLTMGGLAGLVSQSAVVNIAGGRWLALASGLTAGVASALVVPRRPRPDVLRPLEQAEDAERPRWRDWARAAAVGAVGGVLYGWLASVCHPTQQGVSLQVAVLLMPFAVGLSTGLATRHPRVAHLLVVAGAAELATRLVVAGMGTVPYPPRVEGTQPHVATAATVVALYAVAAGLALLGWASTACRPASREPARHA